MKWALALNLIFSILELIGGLWIQSMAIVSDALHDFGDALSLGIGIWLEKKSEQGGDLKYSYGYRRFSLMASVFTGGVLITGSLLIIISSVERLFTPQPVDSYWMMAFAVLGVFVNGLAFAKLKGGHSHHGHAHHGHSHHGHAHHGHADCHHGPSHGHMRMWELHFIEDLIGWIIVLIGAVMIHLFSIFWLDPLLAVGLSIWILFNVVRNLKGTLGILLQGTPSAKLLGELQAYLDSVKQIRGHHHLHVWSLDGEKHILTGHILLGKEFPLSQLGELKSQIKSELKSRFQIFEATLEFEWEGEHCADPEHP